MPVLVSEGERRDSILPPADLHQAVCYGVWPIGLQENTYLGKPTAPVDTVIVAWELEETIPTGEYAGKRFCIQKWYRRSLKDKANLLKDLVVWRNRQFTAEEKGSFDLEKLIGINCLLTIARYKTQAGKDRAKVSAIMPLKKGMMPMKPENGPDTPEWVLKLAARAISLPASHGHVEEELDAVETEVEEVPF